MLFHEDINIKQQAKDELQNYLQMIAQASFHDLYDIQTTTTSSESDVPPIHKINTALKPTNDQDLRKMRHHMHCKTLHGVIGNYPHTFMKNDSILNSSSIVKTNTQVLLDNESSISDFNNAQLDTLAYTYPYHIVKIPQ